MKNLIKNVLLIALILVVALNLVSVYSPDFLSWNKEVNSQRSSKFLEGIIFLFYFFLITKDYASLTSDYFWSFWVWIFAASIIVYIGTLAWLEIDLCVISHLATLIFYVASHFQVLKMEKQLNKSTQV